METESLHTHLENATCSIVQALCRSKVFLLMIHTSISECILHEIFSSNFPFYLCKTTLNCLSFSLLTLNIVTRFQSSLHHIVYAITKLPRIYAECHYDNDNDLLRTHVEAKIAASSACLPVLTMRQNHCCSTLWKGQWNWPEVKVINKEQQATKVWCKLCRSHSKDVPSYSKCKPAQTAMMAFIYFV